VGAGGDEHARQWPFVEQDRQFQSFLQPRFSSFRRQKTSQLGRRLIYAPKLCFLYSSKLCISVQFLGTFEPPELSVVEPKQQPSS
jgi:hypothetical protein